ncbi:MAG: hypothetical protein ONB44_01375 [candidate division KSB1 bacterium]|nr:hypothetical protein [candidate division KSB1 bacterium]MDZ7300770.1 hypothetical protein [candidate division KSB1 bacterium]MDZ7309959.1 hypothetical protein [candidate division KSB1 bacterium]
MKSRAFFSLTAMVIMLGILRDTALAHTPVRSTGIGLRGSYWNMNNGPVQIIVSEYPAYTSVDFGNAGGWMYFFSRVEAQTFFEFSLGAVGNIKSESITPFREDVDVTAVTPVLLGFRHNLLSIHSPSALQPYIAYGAGPYWLHDVKIRNRYYEDEVTVKSKVKPGAYAGAGMNFMLASWVGLNFDVKYHFVDFNVNHDYSGFDYGLGFSFMWGRYKPEHRR